MPNCAVNGGCSSDYIAISLSILSFILLLAKWTLPYVIHKIPRPKGSSFWLVAIQVIASFNLLLSLVMALNFLRLKNRWWWISCYFWAVWVEGPFGFGLLLSCRIAQAYKLYYIFLKRRLPPVRSYKFLPLILLPWIAAAAFIHIIKPLNQRCHLGTKWMIPIICLHGLYVVALICITGAVRHVEFRFDELKELWRGIFVSAFSIGIWVISYVLNEIHDNIAWLQVISRFLLLLMSSLLVLAFFSFSISHPLVSLLSLRRMDQTVYATMGGALEIPDSGLLIQSESSQVIDPDVPLEKLLLNRRFRQSFMAFADSCLAGESVHFYDEVQQLERIPLVDQTRRIYMARHIVEEYIVAGATMEVNISHKTRQDILTTTDLSQPELFKNALNELIHLMKMNLARDYWSSTFSVMLKEQKNLTAGQELEQVTGWNFSPRLSSVHCSDDPFHLENINSDHNSSHNTGW